MLMKNYRFQILFMVLQLLIFFSCSSSSISLPNWVQSPQFNLSENQHAYVGMGKEPLDALANALVLLGISKNGTIETISKKFEQGGSDRIDQYLNTSTLSSQCSIGDIRIEVSSKRVQEEIDDETELDRFQRTFKITWLSGDDILFFYNGVFEEINDEEEIKFNEYAKDADLQAITQYLKELNITTEILTEKDICYARLVTSE